MNIEFWSTLNLFFHNEIMLSLLTNVQLEITEIREENLEAELANYLKLFKIFFKECSINVERFNEC